MLSGLLWSCQKRPDKKARVNFKICDVTNCETHNWNTHITQELSQEIKTIKQ